MNIETALEELLQNASQLNEQLKPFSKEIKSIYSKPLEEMGVSEMIKVAKLMLSVSKDGEE